MHSKRPSDRYAKKDEQLIQKNKELTKQARMSEIQEAAFTIQIRELEERRVLICHQNELLYHCKEREAETLCRVEELNEHLQEFSYQMGV